MSKYKIIIVCVLLLCFAGWVASCAPATIVKPQTAAEAALIAEASLIDLNNLVKSMAQNIGFYWNMGAISTENANQYLNVLSNIHDQILEAGKTLDAAEAASDLLQIKDVQEITIPAIRKILRQVILELAQYQGA